MDPFSNPDELFDVYDGAGRPAGRVKRRADVHRDGDWHRSFHCWVACEAGRADGAPALLLQRRGPHKDTWPNRLDVSVGGHYRAGEVLVDVLREVEEEIGRAARLEDLVYLGRRVYVGEQEPGVRDRELQEVYLWRSSLRLEDFRPQPVEVTALEAAALPDLLGLFAGQLDRIATRALRPLAAVEDGFITLGDFIPTLDRYFFRVATVADLAARGYPYLVI
ncbi:MAG: NUDIX domain-containing protein [Chloroflexi bacterium]|nr:NUDIX domain-containing protein [Chloroflexota bacterium]